MNQKGFAPVLLLLTMLLAGVIAIVGYKLLPKPGGGEYIKSLFVYPRPTPTSTPEPGCYYEEVQCIKAPCPPVLRCPAKEGSAETANWKTYMFSAPAGVDGFSFKYPQDMTLKEENMIIVGRQGIALQFSLPHVVEGVTLNEYVASEMKAYNDSSGKIETVMVGNLTGLAFTVGDYTYTYIQSPKYPSTVVYIITVNRTADQDTKKVINQVLSTFKFTQ